MKDIQVFISKKISNLSLSPAGQSHEAGELFDLSHQHTLSIAMDVVSPGGTSL
jgi:hypothetical protein